VLLEAFLSLLTRFGPRVDGDDGGSADGNGPQVDKNRYRKEYALGMLQVPQTVPSLPVAQAYLVVATQGLPSARDPSVVAGQDGSAAHSSLVALPPDTPGASTIGMTGPDCVSIESAISSPTSQASNTPGSTPIAFAVRLTDTSGQIPSAPERCSDAAIRLIDATVSTRLPDYNLVRLPIDPGAPSALLAASIANAEPVESQAVARETAHSGLETTTNNPATVAFSARSAAKPAASLGNSAALRQEETINASLPALTAPVAARTESDLSRNTDAHSLTVPDTRTIATPGAETPETKPALAAQPAREINMRLVQPESPSVDIRVVDRAGSVRVAVRTTDTNLTQNLQSGLSDLVHRLERRGFETEVWAPHTSNAASSQTIRSSNEASAFQNGARDPRDSQQGNGGQQNNGRNRPRWVAELEQKLTTGDGE
jgi:hypothetical protein